MVLSLPGWQPTQISISSCSRPAHNHPRHRCTTRAAWSRLPTCGLGRASAFTTSKTPRCSPWTASPDRPPTCSLAAHIAAIAMYAPPARPAGWRIYEGGGGVKGNRRTRLGLLFCGTERAAPLSRKRGEASAATPLPRRQARGAPLRFADASVPSFSPCELLLTHLSGRLDQDFDTQPGAS